MVYYDVIVTYRLLNFMGLLKEYPGLVDGTLDLGTFSFSASRSLGKGWLVIR